MPESRGFRGATGNIGIALAKNKDELNENLKSAEEGIAAMKPDARSVFADILRQPFSAFSPGLTVFRLGWLLAGLLCAMPVWSKSPATPLQLPGAMVVTAEKAQTLMGQGAILIDARVAHEFAGEHIRGAISLPYKEKSRKHVDYNARLDSFDVSRLPADKNAAIIFYCNAGECWKSYKASRAAVKAGYRRVYWLRGGIPEWKAKGLPVE